MREENIFYLRRVYPEIYKQMKTTEENLGKSPIRQDAARNGEASLYRQGEKTIRIHSAHDPSYEAGRILEQYPQIEKYDHVLFFGTGLGYHVDLVISKYPDKKVYIYEPIRDIFCYYLSRCDLPQKQIAGLHSGTQGVPGFIAGLLAKTNQNIMIIELPCYKEQFPDEYSGFFKPFRQFVQGKRSSIYINAKYQKHWICNCIYNLPQVIRTVNLLQEGKGAFRNKPAMIIGAGPSLDEDIENIRQIKQSGTAYLFTIGSAVNTLLEKGILPDATFSYHPDDKNMLVFQKIVDENITSLPLVFGSSVNYKSLARYPGPKAHAITNQDTLAPFYLRGKDGKSPDSVTDAPSIVSITFQVLYRLGFNPIIFAGQNLAYKEGKHYAEGISYGRSKKLNSQNAIEVQDVYGKVAYTTPTFNEMRKNLESYICSYTDLQVLNTTKGGANISGAPFVPLETLMTEKLTERVVDDRFLQLFRPECQYDEPFLTQQAIRMQGACQNLEKEIFRLKCDLKKVENLAANRNWNQIKILYDKIDSGFRKIKENDFFKRVILPMNRVQHEILGKEVETAKLSRNPAEKAGKIAMAYMKFIYLCEQDIQETAHVFQEVYQKIIEGKE